MASTRALDRVVRQGPHTSAPLAMPTGQNALEVSVVIAASDLDAAEAFAGGPVAVTLTVSAQDPIVGWFVMGGCTCDDVRASLGRRRPDGSLAPSDRITLTLYEQVYDDTVIAARGFASSPASDRFSRGGKSYTQLDLAPTVRVEVEVTAAGTGAPVSCAYAVDVAPEKRALPAHFQPGGGV
jgi:hypothetical protein